MNKITGRVVITAGPLAGAAGVVIRQSKITGGLTVQLLEALGAYGVGSEVNVAAYEVEPDPDPTDDNPVRDWPRAGRRS